MKNYIITGLLLLIIVNGIFNMLETNNRSNRKQEIISLKAQLKVCQEMPMPKCESLEERVQWCESKIINQGEMINRLLRKPNGLD